MAKTTYGNVKYSSGAAASSGLQASHTALQLIDLVCVLGFIAGLLLYRVLLPGKLRRARNVYPNPAIYSLQLKRHLLPSKLSSEDFAARFLNTDNIIQTAVGRDFDGLIAALEKLCDLGRQIRQMECDLSTEPHVAKNPKSCSNRPSDKKLAKLDLAFRSQVEVVRSLRSSKSSICDYAACTGIITFATMKSKHRFLEALLEALKAGGSLPEKFQFDGKKLEFEEVGDPKDLNYRHASDTGSKKLSCFLFGLLLLAAVLLFTAAFVVLSFGVSVPATPDCSVASSGVALPQCTCSANSVFAQLSMYAPLTQHGLPALRPKRNRILLRLCAHRPVRRLDEPPPQVALQGLGAEVPQTLLARSLRMTRNEKALRGSV